MGAGSYRVSSFTHRVHSGQDKLRQAAQDLLGTELSIGQQGVEVARDLDPTWPRYVELGLHLLKCLIYHLLPCRCNKECDQES